MTITPQKAYKLAKKYIRKSGWYGEQVQLATVKESETKWLFRFVPFAPEPIRQFTGTYDSCKISGIMGIIPYYYGGGLLPVEIDKESGDCREIIFSPEDYVSGKVDEYYSQFQERDARLVFETRKSNGSGYQFEIIERNLLRFDSGDVVRRHYANQ